MEYTAYLPLFYGLAEQGIDGFLIKMPCNLAILGQNKAEDIMEAYEYKHWYLAGHSLGGAMAASYAAGHPESFDGLILLAAYLLIVFCLIRFPGSKEPFFADVCPAAKKVDSFFYG